MTLSSCHPDPVRALAPVLTRMPGAGIPLGDILADSGYAHRDADAWAIPLRAAGAQLVQDLHPHDRGPQGTHPGAIIANGNLYCPATPTTAAPGPAAPAAAPDDIAAHDQQTAELARHKLGRLTADDADGYHRVTCPAAAGKLRCPLRPASMTLDRVPARDPDPAGAPAGLLHPADHHRPTRRRGEDPAETRLPLAGAPPLLRPPHQRRTGLLHHQRPRQQHHRPRLVPPHGPAHRLALWLAALLAVRNQRILTAWNTRQDDNDAPRRRRAPAQNPQTPPENHPRQPHRAALTTRRHTAPQTRRSPARRHRALPPPDPGQQPIRSQRTGHAQETQDQPVQAARMSDPNVNMVPTET